MGGGWVEVEDAFRVGGGLNGQMGKIEGWKKEVGCTQKSNVTRKPDSPCKSAAGFRSAQPTPAAQKYPY